jgi:hypothetical protein
VCAPAPGGAPDEIQCHTVKAPSQFYCGATQRWRLEGSAIFAAARVRRVVLIL